MTPKVHRDASFIVRIWWEHGESGQIRWRGQAVHATTRQFVYFDDVPSLLTFLEQWAGSLQPISQPPMDHSVERPAVD